MNLTIPATDLNQIGVLAAKEIYISIFISSHKAAAERSAIAVCQCERQ